MDCELVIIDSSSDDDMDVNIVNPCIEVPIIIIIDTDEELDAQDASDDDDDAVAAADDAAFAADDAAFAADADAAAAAAADDDDDNDDAYDADYDMEVNVVLDDLEHEMELNNVGLHEDQVENQVEDAQLRIQPLVDSGCESDFDEESSNVQFIHTAELLSINPDSRMCVLYSCYIPWEYIKLCSDCFMRHRQNFTNMCVIREHETVRYRDVQREYCYDCRTPLYIMFHRNICPVCHRCKYLIK